MTWPSNQHPERPTAEQCTISLSEHLSNHITTPPQASSTPSHSGSNICMDKQHSRFLQKTHKSSFVSFTFPFCILNMITQTTFQICSINLYRKEIMLPEYSTEFKAGADERQLYVFLFSGAFLDTRQINFIKVRTVLV